MCGPSLPCLIWLTESGCLSPLPAATELSSAPKGQGPRAKGGMKSREKGTHYPLRQAAAKGTGAFQGPDVKGSKDNSEGCRQGP